MSKELKNRGQSIAERRGRETISPRDVGAWMMDASDEIDKIAKNGTTGLLYLGFDVATTAHLTKPTIKNPETDEIITLKAGHAVRVLDKVNDNGEPYYYQYDGENWNETRFTALPSDTPTKADVILRASSDLSVPTLGLGLSSRKNNKNLYYEALIGDFFSDTERGQIYHLNSAPNPNLVKDYRGVIIPISEGLDYTLSGYNLGVGKVVTILDKDNNPLDTRNLNVAYTGTAITIDTPQWSDNADIHIRAIPNSAYVAINVASTAQPNYWRTAKIQFEVGTQKTDYIKGEGGLSGYVSVQDAKQYSKVENINTISPIINTPYRGRATNKNLYSLSYMDDFYADTTRGQLYKSSGSLSSYRAVLIPIMPNLDYTLSGYNLGVGKVISLLDANFNPLDTRNLNVAYTGTAITIDAPQWSDNADIHIRTFEDCTFLVINIATTAQPHYWRTAKIQFEVGTQKTDYVKGERGTRSVLTLDDLDSITNKSKRNGEKLVIVGTSIPATGYDQKRHSDKAYPAIIGANLGANVINEAESSSQVRYAFVDGLEFDKEHQRLALSLTKAERKARGVSEDYGYEQKLLSPDRIDADLFIFDHAINDAHRDTIGFNVIPKKENGVYNIEGLTDDYVLREDGGVPELLPDWQNRKTFIGAMNFIISEILKVNPKARFAFITHHENQCPRDVLNTAIDGTKRRSTFNSSIVIEAQKVLAEYWSAPILMLHEKMGWSQRVVNGKTIYNHFVPDQLHPNQDTTGYSTNLIAWIISMWLETI